MNSCSSGTDVESPGNDDDQTVIVPENLAVTFEIAGQSPDFPNGDGSGLVVFSAEADNAVTYGFRFGQGELESITGVIEYEFNQAGTNTYPVYVYAYSSTGHFVNTALNVTVYIDDAYQLVWSDEFDEAGTFNAANWSAEIGNGCPNLCGWGNGESEYYTDRMDNVKVEDGKLKITAKKEDYAGYEYTSARIKTQDKFEFTYGRVEVRAKLPEGEGTWPAIWMLGANIDEPGVGWPNCGEMDIMEHWGHNETVISAATHTPSSSGDTVNKGATTVSDYASNFHIYRVDWSSEKLEFYVDDELFYTYQPSVYNTSTWPFNGDQFIILNVAMGGSWFEIDPNFTESTMEIDYVRVYQ